jgi:hypothetical protein
MRAEFASYGHLGVVVGPGVDKPSSNSGDDTDVDTTLDADTERGEARFVSVADAADDHQGRRKLLDRSEGPAEPLDGEICSIAAAASSSPGAAKVPALWALITRCWSNDPKKRPSFATIQLELDALDNKPMPVKITRRAFASEPATQSVERHDAGMESTGTQVQGATTGPHGQRGSLYSK